MPLAPEGACGPRPPESIKAIARLETRHESGDAGAGGGLVATDRDVLVLATAPDARLHPQIPITRFTASMASGASR